VSHWHVYILQDIKYRFQRSELMSSSNSVNVLNMNHSLHKCCVHMDNFEQLMFKLVFDEVVPIVTISFLHYVIIINVKFNCVCKPV